MIKKDERNRNMRNFFKKFSALILSATMLLTSGVFLPNVSAAELMQDGLHHRRLE